MIAPYRPEPELGPQHLDPDDLPEPLLGDTLTEGQLKQARHVLEAFPKTFTVMPGQTTLVHHWIQTNPREVVCEPT